MKLIWVLFFAIMTVIAAKDDCWLAYGFMLAGLFGALML